MARIEGLAAATLITVTGVRSIKKKRAALIRVAAMDHIDGLRLRQGDGLR